MKPAQGITHPDMRDPTVLQRVAGRLKQAYGAEKVIVYGSVARGEATVDSDIDLLVIAPDTENGYRRMATVTEILESGVEL